MNKIFIEPPLNYTGSKYKLLSQILPEFDYSKNVFVDLFTGGGSVYSNILDRYEKVIINDVIVDLIGIHREFMNSDDIISKTKQICPDKIDSDSFNKLRENYNNNPSPEGLWALILSCNSNLMRFNQKGKFNQTWGKRSWNSQTDRKVEDFKSIRKYKNKISYNSDNFNNIEIIEPSFFYIDPPYGYIKKSDGSIGTKQISSAGYNCFYYQEDDINLYNYCHKINNNGSTFMISGVLKHGNETTWILDKLINDGFNYKQLNCNYEKINKSGSSKNTVEIIITNY